MAPVVLNPSPARPVAADVLGRVDVLIVNRSELALLAGEAEPATSVQAARMAGRLSGPAAVVVTLGSDGAVLVGGGAVTEVPAVPVERVVDPTGAGDTFTGALADALVRGEALDDAVRWAVEAAAIAVTAAGRSRRCPPANRFSRRERGAGRERRAAGTAGTGRCLQLYPGVRALDSVDFDVRGGEVHVLLGENGAGKSTLIKMMAGVHQPDTGEIRVDGAAVRLRGPATRRRWASRRSIRRWHSCRI